MLRGVEHGRKINARLAETVHQFLRSKFNPHFGQLPGVLGSSPAWSATRAAGSELWLDTGDMDEIAGLWSAIGRNDQQHAAEPGNPERSLRPVHPGGGRRAPALCAWTQSGIAWRWPSCSTGGTGCRLVEKFDAHVSVEEHTDLAGDVEETLEYCAVVLRAVSGAVLREDPADAGRSLGDAAGGARVDPCQPHPGVLGQAELRGGRPRGAGVRDVFLGRLNQFVADNDLAPGPTSASGRRWPRRRRLGGCGRRTAPTTARSPRASAIRSRSGTWRAWTC